MTALDDTTTAVPELPEDQSLAFLREGYPFGHRRFLQHDTDAFRARLLGRRVLFLRGGDAAQFFYGEDRFTRKGALPRSVLHSLQDEGSVQTLDGTAHRVRRGYFLEVLDPSSRGGLAQAFTSAWNAKWDEWTRRARPVSVVTGSGVVLADATLRWLGLGPRCDADARAAESLAMIDGAGAFGPRNWWGRMLRRRSERWARRVIGGVRSGELDTVPGSPVETLAWYRDADGPLDEGVAAVELLNLLRPIVAVSRFIGFAALALHRHPDWRVAVAQDDRNLHPFSQEVRRASPFFPAVGGRATHDTSWQGIDIAADDWVMLDIFATHRDPGRWIDPERFDPTRFGPTAGEPGEPGAPGVEAKVLAQSPNLVPQGAGSMTGGHRCPGEPATVDLLALATRMLARSDWEVPDQDLAVDLSRLPALPGRHGMLIVPREPRVS